MRVARIVGLLVVVSAAFTAPAHAVPIQLDHGDLYSTQYYGVGTMGGGRGLGANVTTSFHMSTLGINIGVPTATSQLFQFQIYSSVDGHSAGSLLDSTSFNLATGEGWQDFAFDFDFVGGSSYVINFTGVDNTVPTSFGVMYSWEPSAYFNYGMLSVVEGFEGAFPNSANPLVAHFRIDTAAVTAVPEPATLALLGLGLAGLGLARRRTKRELAA